MAKIVTYLILLTGVLAIMNLAGILPANAFLTLFSWDNISNVSTSTIVVAAAVAIAAGVAVGSIKVGFVGVSITESSILAVFSGALMIYLIAALVSIDNTMGLACALGSECRWAYNIVKTVLFMMIGGLIVAIISWWGGGDN